MTLDYWSWIAATEKPAVDQTIGRFTGKPGERTAWMQQHLTPKLRSGAQGLMLQRFFDRAAVAYHEYSAANDKRANDVRDAYRAFVGNGLGLPPLVSSTLRTLGLDTPVIDLTQLPRHSILWRFRFSLATPYISRDDDALYVIDNPVRKEQLLKIPMVAATGWKGALRSAYRQTHNAADSEDNVAPDIARLFGMTRDDDSGTAGALHFFSSYFDRIGMMVINPHDRKTGIGASGPIYFETVPAASPTTYTMLLVPPLAASAGTLADDVERISAALTAMLLTYGFGAKTSSGYGSAADALPDSGQAAVKLTGGVAAFEFGALSQLPEAAKAMADALRQEVAA